jgi:hypothetical protein
VTDKDFAILKDFTAREVFVIYFIFSVIVLNVLGIGRYIWLYYSEQAAFVIKYILASAIISVPIAAIVTGLFVVSMRIEIKRRERKGR